MSHYFCHSESLSKWTGLQFCCLVKRVKLISLDIFHFRKLLTGHLVCIEGYLRGANLCYIVETVVHLTDKVGSIYHTVYTTLYLPHGVYHMVFTTQYLPHSSKF